MTLDPAGDPDRFVPDEEADLVPGLLDPALDPDRFRDPTLPGLLGAGAQEDERNNLTWLFGLLGVLAFLLLVSVLIRL